MRKSGADPLMRARREWLGRALLGGAAVPLLLRDALAARTHPGGLVKIEGEVLINGSAARKGAPVRPGDSLITAPGGSAVFVVGQDAFLLRGGSDRGECGKAENKGGLRKLHKPSDRDQLSEEDIAEIITSVPGTAPNAAIAVESLRCQT